MPVSFAGKKVLVTGGGNGLGKAIVKKMYEDGATVCVLDNNKSSIDELKEEFSNVNAECVDLTNFEEARKIVESFGPLDHLVNNAGILVTQSFLDMDLETMNRVLDVNFKSIIVVSQAVARGMIANNIQGSIVNVASVAAVKAAAGIGSYCCSKAAVLMLTKIMAIELGPHNIRVNCISPAIMDTQMVVTIPGMTEEQRDCSLESWLGRNIIKRLIQPSEAADLILFLLGPTAAMITGENVLIDGGYTTS